MLIVKNVTLSLHAESLLEEKEYNVTLPINPLELEKFEAERDAVRKYLTNLVDLMLEGAIKHLTKEPT